MVAEVEDNNKDDDGAHGAGGGVGDSRIIWMDTMTEQSGKALAKLFM